MYDSFWQLVISLKTIIYHDNVAKQFPRSGTAKEKESRASKFNLRHILMSIDRGRQDAVK